jgi:hypothetical protein
MEVHLHCICADFMSVIAANGTSIGPIGGVFHGSISRQILRSVMQRGPIAGLGLKLD